MLASSVFASLNPTLAKVGFHGVNSNLSTGVFWLYYYKALQTGAAFKVISIAQLRVVITMTLAILLCAYFIPNAIIGCILNAAGILLVVL
jgi:uncharacterized membrane protein